MTELSGPKNNNKNDRITSVIKVFCMDYKYKN